MLFRHEFHHFINHKTKKERSFPLEPDPGRITSLINYIKRGRERASLYTFASLTIEAAVILPLFLLAMLTLIGVLNVYQTKIISQMELSEKAKKMSVYACLTDGYMNEEYIDLAEVKGCKLAVSILPGYQVKVALRGRVHKWTGRSDKERQSDADYIGEELVYVTENQSVYHTDSHCTYLELSIRGVQKEDLFWERNESGGKYHSCEKCLNGTSNENIYYISENGDKYHGSQSCPGLTRKVRLIRRSEASNISCCSRCMGING